MAGPATHITAAKTDRSLVSSSPSKQTSLKANPHLLFWRRFLDKSLSDALLMSCGLPTDSAILARYWIEEYQPSQANPDEWEVSFECVCHWVELDAAAERVRLLQVIDDAWKLAAVEFARVNTSLRRAAVLACAGLPTTIGGQYQMPLVGAADYEHVAGIDHPDPPARHKRRHDTPHDRLAA